MPFANHLRDMENVLVSASARINRELMNDEAKNEAGPGDEKGEAAG